MTPTEVTEILRHLDGWPVQSHSCKKVQEAIDAAIEMIDRLAALPARITPEQAPDGVRDYCHEAAEGYADGWNACMKAMRGEGK